MKSGVASVMRSIGSVLCCAFLCSGCASWPGTDLTQRTLTDIPRAQNKVGIDYDISCFAPHLDRGPGERVVNKYQEVMTNLFDRAGVFASSTLGRSPETLHLSVVIENLAHVSELWKVSCMTLFVIPGYTKDEYRLRVDVRQGSQLLKRYHYNQSMHTWGHLLLLPLMLFQPPGKAERKVIENLFMHFLYDLQKDGVLSSPYSRTKSAIEEQAGGGATNAGP